MADSADPVVLVVDDDPQVGRLYAEFLADQYEVTLVESGDAALEAMSSTIDVVLLDRRMPGLSGNDVLEQLRENGYDQPVAIITAVEPDFDILKMGFDDYVVKPVTGDQLCELVETILLRKEYDSLVRDYFSLVSKVTALEQEKSPRELKTTTTTSNRSISSRKSRTKPAQRSTLPSTRASSRNCTGI